MMTALGQQICRKQILSLFGGFPFYFNHELRIANGHTWDRLCKELTATDDTVSICTNE